MIQQMEGGVELLVVDGFSADTDSVKGWDSKWSEGDDQIMSRAPEELYLKNMLSTIKE